MLPCRTVSVFIDNASMRVLTEPTFFDVIVTENTFGDILTDETSCITGSMGLQPSNPAPSGDIGHAKAKSIALNHAGVSENKAYDMEIELDDEDGTLVYEVEFKSGGMEYSYEINAATGAILKHEAELDD